MKQLSSVLLLAVLVKLASSKISNAVPSFSKAHNNQRVSQARPVRDAPVRIGEPVYMTIDELQRGAYEYPLQWWQPSSDYRDASPRTCFSKKGQVHIQPQPVYYPVQEYHQVAVPHTEYETITVPHTEYHQVTVPHTEYHQVSVPVQHSYQSYSGHKGCYKSADGVAMNPVEYSAVNSPLKSAEFADPTLQDSALYKAIAKPLTSTYKDADINRNAQYQADAYQRSVVAPEVAYSPYYDTARSADFYQASAQVPDFGRQAQYLPDGKSAYNQGYQAPIPEMRTAIAPEILTPEGRAAQVYQTADFGRDAAYQADGRYANADITFADLNQRAAITPEVSQAAYADFNQRSAIVPPMNRAAFADSNQRAAIAPEANQAAFADFNQRAAVAPPSMNRAAWADFNQRAAVAPEVSQAAFADFNQRAAVAPPMNRAAWADLNQRAAVAPEVSQAAFNDFNQRAAVAPQMNRGAYSDFSQRTPAIPEWWNHNAMYQPDGRSAYADSYQRSAIAPSSYADTYQRNAFVPEHGQYKSAAMEKAPLAPEGKPMPAAPLKKSTSESSQKGKSESSAHHE